MLQRARLYSIPAAAAMIAANAYRGYQTYNQYRSAFAPTRAPLATYGVSKGKKGKKGLRYGKKHVKVVEQTAGTLSSSNIVDGYDLTGIIGIGDLIDQRQSNNILSRYVHCTLNLNNINTVPRYVRVLLVQVRPSSTAPALGPSWSDLFMDASYTAQAPNGLCDQIVWRVNGEHYKKLYDKVIRVEGFGNEGAAKTIKMLIKTRKLVKYAYNSADVRTGELYLIFAYNEAEGNAAHGSILNYSASIRHAYTDIDN